MLNNTTDLNSTVLPGQVGVARPVASSPYCVGFIASYGLVAILILLGNLLSLVIFLRTKALRRKPFFLLISLSFVDFFMGVYAVSFCAGFMFSCGIIPAKYYSVKARDIFQWFFLVPFFASVHTLAAISIERVIAVVFPFYHRVVGRGFYVALVLVPWILAGGYTVVSEVFSTFIGQPQVGTNLYWTTATACLIIIIVSYTAVFVKVKSSHVVNNNHAQNLRDRKLAVTLLIVTVASVATWLPWLILQPITVYCQKCNATLSYEPFLLLLLVCVNSAINIFIYAGRIPAFREVLLGLLCKGRLLDVAGSSDRRSAEHNDTNTLEAKQTLLNTVKETRL
ncbi:lysophosphatidic acid receptor 1-A [Nematostella vectensis]|uniref:lysophosphatidic acid receptor 1-A n=1 Tax=Nematostella vectensis TaxID=45351 RepID=UPI0020775FD3|nr:lysophosphatidic acid receptor 1-A [Nematostella vectensis]XP_032242165.2 lysophosphatidic acid receptor 1-A [Nematostella vectensis]XP_032242166.2 lysophosphatidic acid receptor 1-A [Nematostella vectensis]XP_048589741.1 lysophosphatidic acid receptor 1-A [Nematostella vectensis]